MRGVILCFVWILVNVGTAMAQCSMCRTQVENNVSDGDTSFAAGLNFGILYLFAAPYLMVMIIAFLWYRQSRVNAGASGSSPLINRNRI